MKIFWSWQSDIDPDISRFFIKDCITKAIKKLNEEAYFDERIEIDHDTKDIPGSPPITETILKKIKECSVFVADVTPIASIKKDDGDKKIMNPNVAIEMGYAMAIIDDTKIITIMNDSFGSLNDLPFDLKYKRGPITYTLKNGAEKSEIKKEEEKLISIFKNALKFYINDESKVEKETEFNLDLNGPAIFYDVDKPLLRVSDDGWSEVKDKEIKVKMEKSYIYIKITPQKELLFNKNEISKAMFDGSNFKIYPLFKSPDNTPVINKYGSIIFKFDADDKNYITDFTQVFKNASIIGISNSFLYYSRNKLYLINLRQGLKKTLTEGVNLLKNLNSSNDLDLNLEIGLVNKDNCKIILPGSTGNRAYSSQERGPLEEEIYISKIKINTNDTDKIDKIIKEFILSLLNDIGQDFNYEEHIWN